MTKNDAILAVIVVFCLLFVFVEEKEEKKGK